jgi:hypothetical protein
MKSLLHTLIAATTLLIAATPASARLGESPSQCTARYGQPIAVDQVNRRATYYFQGIRILIYFLDDRAQRITYTKTPTTRVEDRQPLSDQELLALIRANGDGGPWKSIPAPTETTLQWANGNPPAERFAAYDQLKPSLLLVTQAFLDHAAATEKDRLSRF